MTAATTPATERPSKVRDISGQKFNMLTAISFIRVKGKARQAEWLFKCDCGSDYVALSSNVIAGTTKACGCLMQAARLRHGDSNSRTYKIYYAMLGRCHKKGRPGYEHYGGLGIAVCDRWRESYKNFLQDMGPCPDGMSIDRINPLKNYGPDNCEWSHIVAQNNNRRSHWVAFAKAEREKAIRECAAKIEAEGAAISPYFAAVVLALLPTPPALSQEERT